LGRALVLATAPLALRAGVEVDHVTDRLLAEAEHEAAQILAECLRDGSVAARRAIATRMGQIGNRAYRDALVTAAAHDRDARVRKLAECALAGLDLRPRYRLRFETLGRFRAFRGDEEIGESEWRGITVRRLLARLLVAEGRAVSREVLIEDLWPDADPKQARNHLRVSTSRLHAVLEPDRPEGVAPHFVRSEGDSLVFGMEGAMTWDAREFEKRLSSAQEAGAARGMDELLQLFETSAGRLFPELRDEPWLEPVRRRLEQRWVGLGRAVGAALLSSSEFTACERVAGLLLERDAADEAAWALRIRVRLGRGERARALRVYDEATEALRRTVDASPGPELDALAAEARVGST
jgi:DNA-binding SARP family transcriptional activator